MLKISRGHIYDILYVKYVDTVVYSVCNLPILKIFNFERPQNELKPQKNKWHQNISDSVDIVEAEKHWSQKLTFF